MREIKFRQWDKDLQAFMFFELNNGRLHVTNSGIESFDIDRAGIPQEQFTGLKDARGVDIYEGDIVQVSGDDGYYVNAKVVYECGAFWFYSENISLVFDEDCDKMVMLGSMYVEGGDGGNSLDMTCVAGNIHANPELLGADHGKA